jgi:hypothetical protein
MSEKKAALLIRISAQLKQKLVKLAEREHRSLNQQIEFLLERAANNSTTGSSAREGDLK